MELPKDNCPICGREMKSGLNADILDIWCGNSCYSLEIDGSYTTVTFFSLSTKNLEDIIVLVKYREDEYKFRLKQVFERIEYWRKDYRYIAEILERN